ncbi:hypothetical protein E4U03_12330 [Rothia nasimurium]|uniref:Uncharacterized protein n=1 Tax=Rothia nasimurium TaxID=85336 RepID=A0A4Y9F0Z6_9MICC|nr:hypothetical protein [Rothia nasimurium]MBF0809383.1 hypothetical protein [Rothia nasimurium]TFU19587.1 hypothetical protein E4U03_12330 [Rothia nasimurium]
MTPQPYRETTTVCPHCKEEFTYHNGRGRNPIYCSPTCRKYAAAHRKYAREAGAPMRIIREKPHTEPRKEPKAIRVYQRPRKADMRAYIREEPSKVIPDLLTELSYCLNDRKLPREERAEIAHALGKALTRLARAEWGFVGNEKADVPVSSGLSPQELVRYSQVLGGFEEIAAWVAAEREYTEYEKAVAVGQQVRKAKAAIERESADEIKGLQEQVRKLEKRLGQKEAELEQFYVANAWLREQKLEAGGVLAIARLEQQVASLESLVLGWQRRAEEWEKVAKLERARGEREVARVRAEMLGGGSTFFKGRQSLN